MAKHEFWAEFVRRAVQAGVAFDRQHRTAPGGVIAFGAAAVLVAYLAER
jgi:hypothetical protein